jgi:hypothetical protein
MISIISVNVVNVVAFSEKLRIFIEVAISASLNVTFLNIRTIRLIEFHNLYIILASYPSSYSFSDLTASLPAFLA